VILAIAACIVAVLLIGFIILELDVRSHRSARYLVPIFLSAILIAVLVAAKRGAEWGASFFAAQTLWGFIAGCVFMGALVALIMWIDPASRPRGNSAAADQQGARHRVD